MLRGPPTADCDRVHGSCGRELLGLQAGPYRSRSVAFAALFLPRNAAFGNARLTLCWQPQQTASPRRPGAAGEQAGFSVFVSKKLAPGGFRRSCRTRVAPWLRPEPYRAAQPSANLRRPVVHSANSRSRLQLKRDPARPQVRFADDSCTLQDVPAADAAAPVQIGATTFAESCGFTPLERVGLPSGALHSCIQLDRPAGSPSCCLLPAGSACRLQPCLSVPRRQGPLH